MCKKTWWKLSQPICRQRLPMSETMITAVDYDMARSTAIAEQESPEVLYGWMKAYHQTLASIITRHGGMICCVAGDAMLSVFGIASHALAPELGAYQASKATVAIIQAVRDMNHARTWRGEPPLITRLGVSTGPAMVGYLSIIEGKRPFLMAWGDVCNVAQRLQDRARDFGETSAIVSQATWNALHTRRAEFVLESLGEQTLAGRVNPVPAYRLQPTIHRFAAESIFRF
jgi:adenylate cyclase